MNTNQQAVAEAFLIERGIFRQPSLTRQRALGCIVCNWERTSQESPLNARVSAQDILPCQQITSTTLSQLFAALEKAGMVTREAKREPISFGGLANLIQYFRPADTVDGLHFLDILEPPDVCQQKL